MSHDKELDLTNAARGVWLVKVPKYISSRWEKGAPMSEIGRLKIMKSPQGKRDIMFTLSDEMVSMKEAGEKMPIPKEHSFAISDIAKQTVAVFSQIKGDPDDTTPTENAGKLFLEGNVVQKGECKPTGDDRYMQLKRHNFMLASQPQRSTMQLKSVVQNYKPISDHKHNKDFEQKKKAEGKKSREDRDKVTEMLYAAFEKHQYYNIKDLEKITRQPVPYLKEILKEICNYNAKNPHKNMWELKREYRHYKNDASAS